MNTTYNVIRIHSTKYLVLNTLTFRLHSVWKSFETARDAAKDLNKWNRK